jgi:uncharacterized protein
MKESNYNIYAITAKGVVCFNTVFQTFALMPQKLYHAIQDRTFSNIGEQHLHTLTENHILIDDDFNEEDILTGNYNVTVSEQHEMYELTLLPSLDCNLRCWYCFETHVKDSRLDALTQESIFQHMKQVCQNEHIKQIHIQMFGGEPLLYFKEELYPLLSRIKQYVEDSGKNVNFFFVTNGVCITEEMIPLFVDLKATFQISIDGYRKKHNMVKKIPGSGEDVYKRIMKTIHSLTTAYETYINLRINYDNQTLNHIEEVVKDIIDIDPRRLGIHLERVWQTISKSDNTGYDMNRILGFIMANGFTVSYLNLHRKHVSCKASNHNSAIISYNGDVYKCTGRDFTEAQKEGNLLPDGTIAWDRNKLEKRLSIRTYDNEHCLSCKLLPMCYGPCCQKLLDTPGQVLIHCQKNIMEISMEDYIIYRFNNEILKSKINEIV